MLPPLFGVSWGMYAVIGAILVLLILLLLLVARRKKKDASSARAKSQPAAKAAPRQRPTRADKAARYAQLRQEAASTPMALAGLEDPGAASGADQAFALPQAPLPPVGYSPPAMPPMLPIAPAPRVQSVPMEEILPGTDPLQAVIAEVLNGWGDLTQEDTNRLGVFRPDRVMAAVASTDIPRELKSSEHARARLGQLRRWAAGLEYGSARREQATRTAVQEFAGVSIVPPTAPAPVAAPWPVAPAYQAQAPPAAVPTPPPPPAVAPATAAAAAAAVAAAEAAAAEAAAAAAPAPINIPPAPTPEMVPQSTPAPSPAPAMAEAEWKSSFADAGKSTEAAIAAAAAAFWARPELGGTLPGTTPPAPQAVPLTEPVQVQALPQAPAIPPLGQDLPTLTVPTPVVEAPHTVPLEPAKRTAPQASGDSDTFLEELGSGVSTAEALLALPAAEQPTLLAFLKPAELAKVLKATSDSELKKAVIDTLESVGSPSALDIIYRCLDDPDPQIQSKALAAADRLLGAQ
jgi:hypothetical protein